MRTDLAISAMAFVAYFQMIGIVSGGATCGTADWTSYDATSAEGSIGGIGITVRSSETAPIIGLLGNHFGLGEPCGSWDGTMPLDHADLGVVASYVNAGDFQEFLFSSDLNETFFYIENFDSSSIADITIVGATEAALVDASSSISFTSSIGEDGVEGRLSTSNSGYDGEGDAVLHIKGEVSAIRLDYISGEGANGVFYTFAEPCPIPEPTSVLVFAGLFGVVGFVRFASRRLGMKD